MSKLARLVDCFARRLQIQERLTQQITGAMMEVLKPVAAGCIISAQHQCMMCRGVKKVGASMVTSSLCGAFRTDEKAREEFLSLCR